MLHHVVHARPDQELFTTWEEGCTLWHTLVRALPDLEALCVLPDRIDLLHRDDARARLGHALSGYVRWRNARSGGRGGLVDGPPRVRPLDTEPARRRALRDLHRRPCGLGLVDDPVSWPLSTHLDALGLAVGPARPPIGDRLRFHACVSGASGAQVGSPIPVPGPDPLPLVRVLDAVSTATRTPILQVLARRGPTRSLLVGAARSLTSETSASIADFCGLHPASVRRVPPVAPGAHTTLCALAADPRCHGLHDPVLARALARFRVERAQGWAP